MKTPRLPLSLAAVLVASLSTSPAFAIDYTWAATGGGAWNNQTNWNPATVPDAADANVSFNITESSSILLDDAYAVNNVAVTSQGGRTITFLTPDTTGSYSLAIGGVLSKNNGSSNVAFHDYNTGRLLNLTVNTLDFTSTGNGSFLFGRSDGGRRLNSLAIANLNMGANHASTSIIRLNITNDYSLGKVTFSGTNTKEVYLINNASGSAGYDRTATVEGITQDDAGSTAATIYGSSRASTSVNQATLRIDTAAATDFTASAILADGTGGTLALLKTGEGKQTLTGALAHTGGTRVEEGVLTITGSLAADGDLTVASGAAFIAGAILTVHDASFASGAILGFDLNEGARLSLSGDLSQEGAGPATFVIDFQNTGVVGQIYANLLSVAGTNAFEDAALSYVNFGAEGLSGVMSMAELTGSFGAAIPEPSAWALVLGALALLVVGSRRHRRS